MLALRIMVRWAMRAVSGVGVVLIVEDDERLHAPLRAAVHALGHRVAIAADTDGALDALAHARFDLAVLPVPAADLMPDRAAMLDSIRQHIGYLPSTIFTARRDDDRGTLAGRDFADSIPRPFDLDEFRAVVRCSIGPAAA